MVVSFEPRKTAARGFDHKLTLARVDLVADGFKQQICSEFFLCWRCNITYGDYANCGQHKNHAEKNDIYSHTLLLKIFCFVQNKKPLANYLTKGFDAESFLRVKNFTV